MTRFFAKLITDGGEWGLNLLEFEGPTITQRVTCRGEQNAIFTDLRYNRVTAILSFKIGGEVESFRMHEIDEALGRKLIEPHNWRALQQGLKLKSQKTIDWLAKKGITG